MIPFYVGVIQRVNFSIDLPESRPWRDALPDKKVFVFGQRQKNLFGPVASQIVRSFLFESLEENFK